MSTDIPLSISHVWTIRFLPLSFFHQSFHLLFPGLSYQMGPCLPSRFTHSRGLLSANASSHRCSLSFREWRRVVETSSLLSDALGGENEKEEEERKKERRELRLKGIFLVISLLTFTLFQTGGSSCECDGQSEENADNVCGDEYLLGTEGGCRGSGGTQTKLSVYLIKREKETKRKDRFLIPVSSNLTFFLSLTFRRLLSLSSITPYRSQLLFDSLQTASTRNVSASSLLPPVSHMIPSASELIELFGLHFKADIVHR